MANIREVKDFFEVDLPNYAAYDNTRKLCSGIDGLKVSMRKIIFTMLEKYPGKEKTKTDTVTNICAAFTNYLHGAANLGGVCDTMAQSFVGANNYPLIDGNSSGFGTRINPTCAASRYTKIAINPLVENLLNKDDLEIVGRQYFEGDYIEPKYFIPVFPMLFLNGSHGLSTGYSQDIYPRNPKEIIKYINSKLEGKRFTGNLLPWFRGFTGTVKYNTVTGKLECLGIITQNNLTNYTISELPIGMEYKKYIEILDSLCDNGTIVDYEDKCDTKTDTILFEIKTTREFSRKYDNIDEVARALKLVKVLSENFCCIDQNNRVKEYKSAEEILDDFIDIRLNCYKDRKDYILKTTQEKIDIQSSKYEFCKAVIDGTLVIANTKKVDIIKALENLNNIVKKDSDYNYLLNLPIHSISHDTLDSIKKELKNLKDLYKETKAKDIKDMWKEDLVKIEALL